MTEEKKHWCETCEKGFTTKSNLTTHLRTNKKCLASRSESRQLQYVCKYCDIDFLEKRQLDKHTDKCTVAKKIIEYEERIRILEEKTPKINECGNLKPLTANHIRNCFSATKKLFLNAAQEGPEQIGIYVGENICRRIVTCNSPTRYTIHFMDSEETFIKDQGGLKITKLFFESISTSFQESFDEFLEILEEQKTEAKEDTPDLPETVDEVFQRFEDNIKLVRHIIKSKHKPTPKYMNFQRKFIRGLCRTLLTKK